MSNFSSIGQDIQMRDITNLGAGQRFMRPSLPAGREMSSNLPEDSASHIPTPASVHSHPD